MNLMISMRGEVEQLPYLPEIAALGAGIELGSYGLVGIRSEEAWQARLALHRAVRDQFSGRIAIHGPFIGMEFAHVDHLIRDAVNRRLDLTLDAAVTLRASRVVLHTGYNLENDLFNLREDWLERNIAFWQQEIPRWTGAGIQVVLENDTDRTPDLMVQLVRAVDNPFLGLCMDIGHQHVFSGVDAPEWVRRMGERLFHIHLHDNDGSADRHWSLGRGTIAFGPFYEALLAHAPQATISLEVEDCMEVKLRDLRSVAAYFAGK